MKHLQNRQRKHQIALVLVGASAILAISAGFIPTISMTAWAAFVLCRPAATNCNGTAQSDNIRGTEGADNISALGGDDIVDARGGNDVARGGTGNDIMLGGRGNDRLIGGDGSDTFLGGTGADHFNCGAGTDTIADFNPAQGDTKTADCENF